MGYSVVGVLALAAVACASIGDNTLDGGDKVALIAPVLAPPRYSRTHSADRARQFPILVLLAQKNRPEHTSEPEAKSLGENPQPVYVKKLEDQDKPASESQLNRQKRSFYKKHGGGGGGYHRGGGGGCGCGGGGGSFSSASASAQSGSYGYGKR